MPLDALARDARRRTQRRQRWIGILVLALGVALIVMRCGLASDLGATRLERAHQAIARALAGDPSAFEEAEQSLASAASLTDAYPLFALEATRRLREKRFDDASPAVRSVFTALAVNDLDGAEQALAAIPPTLAGRAELARFVAELRAVRH